MDLQSKIDGNQQQSKGGVRGNKRVPTYIDNTKALAGLGLEEPRKNTFSRP